MCLEAVSEEEARRIWHEDGYTVGLSKGEQKGRSEKAIEDAVMLIKEYKEKPEIAAKKMNAPLNKVLETLKIN